MIELSKHIEILLLEHNCVIVPNLGGFIAQDVPARYVAEENLFLPPHRTVGFNPQLTLNDGLLVQSYMQAYDTNYPETIKLIDQAVSDLKSEIQQTGEYNLNGIGKITLNVDGQYNFTPNEAGILSPSLYGLDSVVVKPVEKNVQKTLEIQHKHSEKPEKHQDNKNYTFSINKEFVNYVAAAVVAVFFYFLLATPVTDSSTMNAQQASMLFPHNIQHIKENIPECVPTATVSVEENQNEEVAKSEETEQDNSQINSDEPYYTIVLVSCIPLKNAEAFIQELKYEGYDDISVLNRRNIIRVVHGKYPTEAEAITELHKLRNDSDRFNEAWILNNNK